MSHETAVQNSTELFEWFMSVSQSARTSKLNVKRLEGGVMVNGKVRKDVLTSVGQGTIIINGEVKRISFNNLGGGVYLATLTKL